MSVERRDYKVKTQKIKYKRLILKTVGTLAVLLSLSCAINPVTGEKEFMLVSEEQGFALGEVFSGKAFHAEVLKNAPS